MPDTDATQADAIRACLDEGRLQEAGVKLREALARWPGEPRLLRLGSEVHRALGDLEASLALARLWIERDPEDWQGYGRAAADLVALGRREELEALGARVRARLPGPLLSQLAEPPEPGAIGRILAKNPRRVELWVRALVDPASPSAWGSEGEPLAPLGSERLPVPLQYWSQGILPEPLEEISARWTSILRDLGLPSLQRFDRQSARQWIGDCAPAFVRPFDSAYHVAIESDVFRVAFASRCAALYIDCDNTPTERSRSVLADVLRAPYSTLFFRTARPIVANGFFISRPHCPFFTRLAAAVQAVDFSLLPQDKSFFQRVGPGAYNRILDALVAREPCKVVAGSGPSRSPMLAFATWSLGFICEQHASRASPPQPIRHGGWSRWQEDLPEAERA